MYRYTCCGCKSNFIITDEPTDEFTINEYIFCSYCYPKYEKMLKIMKHIFNCQCGLCKCWRGEMKGRLNPLFGKVSSAKYLNLLYKNYWMRSTWEVKYAKYLDKNNINWQYESKTFDLGNTTYTPDFYLPKTDEYIEIKGRWIEKLKPKIKLLNRLYPNIKITILRTSDLQKLGVL